jgi:arylsulfatase A-like enzyme
VGRNRVLLATAMLAVIAATACACWLRQREDAAARPNVLLISIDTLRADHLGCYGYPVPTTPNIDAYARERAVLFEAVVAAAPSTEPSHASIFTSLLPSHHGAFLSRRAPLSERFTTLAEIMKQRGYRTLSVNDGEQLDASLGFAQGFDEYVTLPGLSQTARFEKTVRTAMRMLDDSADRSRPFFAFLHSYEVHHPYTPEKEDYAAIGHRYSGPLPDAIDKPLLARINRGEILLDDADRRHIIAAYDAEIHSMDRAFGFLLSQLERRDLSSCTIVVLTSDHGEEMGERGMMGWHSHALWNEQLLVPLIVGIPEGAFAGKRIRSEVRGIDILPTVLELTGTPPLAVAEGRSVMPLVRGEKDTERPAVSQQDVPFSPPPTTLRVGPRKLYLRGKESAPLLFDLAADPGEKNDRYQGDEAAEVALKAQLDSILAARPEAQVAPLTGDADLFERLKMLGYTVNADAGAPEGGGVGIEK